MDKRLKVPMVASALLAGAGALHLLGGGLPGPAGADRDAEPGRPGGVLVAQRSGALHHCQQAARMIFDVHWAAACMTESGEAVPGRAQGHPECDLPDHKAAAVNAWLNEAEAQCVAEAGAGSRP